MFSWQFPHSTEDIEKIKSGLAKEEGFRKNASEQAAAQRAAHNERQASTYHQEGGTRQQGMSTVWKNVKT